MELSVCLLPFSKTTLTAGRKEGKTSSVRRSNLQGKKKTEILMSLNVKITLNK
jgi:hypothetical protein